MLRLPAMKRFLIAGLLISCEMATPTPVASTPTASPEDHFDPHQFTISLVNSPGDDVGSAAADVVARELPTAWRIATRGLSSFSWTHPACCPGACGGCK